ncbi:MAG: hypothetical protein RIK87_22280 [Fuerstiella sp.]
MNLVLRRISMAEVVAAARPDSKIIDTGREDLCHRDESGNPDVRQLNPPPCADSDSR